MQLIWDQKNVLFFVVFAYAGGLPILLVKQEMADWYRVLNLFLPKFIVGN